MRRKKTVQERKKILAEYRKSGLSKRAFCIGKKFQSQTLYRWLRNEGLGEEDLEFVSISPEIKPSEKIFTEKIILKTQSGIAVELPFSISTSWLSSLLKDLA